MEKRINMSIKELSRLEVLKKVLSKQISSAKAAKMLQISKRHTKRLLHRLRNEGAFGLVSKKVGMKGNHRLPQEKTNKVLEFFRKEEHADFGPTLAHEYLVQQGLDGISLSSVRNIMISNGLWIMKRKKRVKIHPLRARRSKTGELTQVDGSEHDWFEGRGARCSLLVYIDDATSKTMHLKFVKSENLEDYLKATKEYLEKWGRPEAFYTDKHSVFRVNREGALSGTGKTQFGRAMEELKIELICANSPQAKGRVERRNKDFQDRLIKAMRLAKICTIEQANAFLPAFLESFNQKFAKSPSDPVDAHKPLSKTHNLDRIFCLKETRKLSKNLTLQYKNTIYQIITDRPAYALSNKSVTVLEALDGNVSVEYKGSPLRIKTYNEMQPRAEEVSAKEIHHVIEEKKRQRYKPSRHHPWKKYYPKSVCV